MRFKSAPHPQYWAELPGTEPGEPPVGGQAPAPPGLAGPEAHREDQPTFIISVAAQMVGMHAQTLRYYERAGLVSPARSKGNIRLYRRSDIDRLRLIQKLIADHGVNLAGVELVLELEERIRQLQGRLEALANGDRRAATGASEKP